MNLFTRRAKNREFRYRKHQCLRKWRHETILSAMAHAKEIAAINQVPMTFYECEHCGWIHVGRLGDRESILMYGGWSENVRELQGFPRIEP